MPRTRIHNEALRGRLLERARDLLSGDGPQALSLRTLARDCNTSTTAVYALFGGKAGLLTALFDEAFHTLGIRLAAVRPGPDCLEDIVALALAYRRSALDDPHVFAMMFAGQTVLPAAAEARTAAGTALGPLREFIERAVQERVLRPDTDRAIASMTLWATVHGWVTLQLRGYLPRGGSANSADPGEDGLAHAVRAVLASWRHPARNGVVQTAPKMRSPASPSPGTM